MREQRMRLRGYCLGGVCVWEYSCRGGMIFFPTYLVKLRPVLQFSFP